MIVYQVCRYVAKIKFLKLELFKKLVYYEMTEKLQS